MKPLIVALLAAAGFAMARYWPPPTGQDLAKPPSGLTAQASAALAPTTADAALLGFARSLATVEPSSLGPLYASLPTRFGPGRIEIARRLVWLRWAETAPLEALAWLKANAPTDLAMFLIAWSESDPTAAWRAASTDCVQARPALLVGLADRLERELPEAAIAILDSFPDEAMAQGDFVITRDAESLYAAAFHKLASANSAEALERALSLTGVRRAAALAGVAAARAEKDPTGTLAWARSLTEQPDRNAALGAVIVDLSRRDTEAAGALLKETDQPFEHTSGGYGPGTIILRRMSKDNPATAYVWAERYASGRVLDNVAGQVITQAAARAHPRDLPAILASIGNEQMRSQAVHALDHYASPGALPELAEGAAGLPEGADRDLILRNIFRAWADHSPDDALDRARALPAGPVRDSALAGTTGKLMSRQPDSPGTLEAINSLPDSVRPRIYVEWLQGIASTSPDKAAALLGEVTDPGAHERIATRIAESWMELDTPAALAFVETLSGSERTSALDRVFAQWSADDPAAITGWIAAQPPGEERDAAIGAFVVGAARQGENEAAFHWSLEVSESPRRRNLIAISAGNLARQDPGLAARVVSEANLTEDERTMVNSLLAAPPPPPK